MFPCEQCGACCRAVGCDKLTTDNLCSIYLKRPFICNVDDIYKKHFSKTIDRHEFYRITKLACVFLNNGR